MATTLIRNGALCGAVEGILAGRGNTAATLASYDAIESQADAIATQFLTANGLLTAPMADADNAQIGQLVQGVVAGFVMGRASQSTTATDYAQMCTAAANAAKSIVAKLV
jgi:hypothetical protein